MFYQVIRVFFKGAEEAHSIQFFDTLRDAQKRYYNIIATDISNSEITYCACYIINSAGQICESRIFTTPAEQEATNE